MASIEIENLTKRYGAMTALDNVSLKIESGEFLVLLGPSGCGKTTLLRCLAGLETPDEGEIYMDGELVFSSKLNRIVPPGKRNLGMVFQSYALWPHMTVRDNVKFGLDVLNLSESDSKDRLDQVLKDLGMSDLQNRYPSELSGGQQQRVALARLLATKPPVFLMDEPLSNLDARLRMDMRVELKKFQASTGSTTVYVTHDQTEAMTMSTRVVVMRGGQIQQVSPPSQLYKRPENTFVADFIGMPRINLIQVNQSDGKNRLYSNGDIDIDIGWDEAPSSIVVGARPEDLKISKKKLEHSPTCEVSSVLPNGPEIIIQLTKGKTILLARIGHEIDVHEGEKVTVQFDQKALNVYDAKSGALLGPPIDADRTN